MCWCPDGHSATQNGPGAAESFRTIDLEKVRTENLKFRTDLEDRLMD